MNRKCKVKIPVQAEETKNSKMMFKKEWACILMDNPKENEEPEPYYYLNGDLIDISGGTGTVVLQGGILMPVPVQYIKLEE